MVWLILYFILLLISPQSNAKEEKHFLYYTYTGLTKAGPFPVFSAEAESDDKQIAYYSNDRQAWERYNLTDWNKAPAEPPETREALLNQLHDLSKCTLTAECSEFHVLQKRIGCEVVKLHDGKVMSLKASDESAYDGKDFIRQMYNQPLPGTKMDHQTGQDSFLTDFHKNCMDWISTFNNTFKTAPDVHVFVRKSPDDRTKLNLSCLATGFYPRDIEMKIRLDKIKLEDQISSGIRPNADETFQMRTSVKIDRKHKGSYDCQIIHSSLTEPAVVEWDGRCSNCEPDHPPSPKTGAVIGGAIIMFLILIVYCFCIKRRRSHGL
ncbi:H-2 class I histocompatibility antigen, D-37 alpha chain-like [Carassius carassius]|uniref:H-2 class I histocompatibility antigen, D-37 alpha chain-like n=1 Tax=Carassius carassius TaxID=217509 RepID=UPI0028684DB9|nr:H-2 class I histocompatibility antigen, D-37 alpha chain-like [Carassius carassius]